MATPEGRIRNAIMSWLKYKRIKCWIFDSVGVFDPVRNRFRVRYGVHRTVGLPDVHGILPGGRFLAIEVKSKTGRITLQQKAWIETINAEGGLAFVARSIKDVETHLAPILARKQFQQPISTALDPKLDPEVQGGGKAV